MATQGGQQAFAREARTTPPAARSATMEVFATMDVFGFALLAALNPTLLTATTVMLLLDHPRRLLFGYLLGAMMTSITLGLLIVFSLEGSSAVSTTKRTLSPLADLALGAFALIIVLVVRTGRHQRVLAVLGERKRAKPGKGPPRWQRFLSGGTARAAFVVGALLTLPGASYLAGLSHLAKKDLTTVSTVLAVVGFNLVMMILLEVPALGYLIAPETTPARVNRFKSWLRRKGPRFAIGALTVIGLLLILKGVIGLLA